MEFHGCGNLPPQNVHGDPPSDFRTDRHTLWVKVFHNTHPMNNLLNIIIAVLVVGWLVGFIGFREAAGSLIHILIVLAVVGVIYQLVSGRKV